MPSQFGGGCKLNTTTLRCNKYDGPSKMGCAQGPRRCQLTSVLNKARKPATAAQLKALAKGRATLAANRAKSAKSNKSTTRAPVRGTKTGNATKSSKSSKSTRTTKTTKKRKPATPAQLRALAKGRAVLAARRAQVGGLFRR